jgi:S-adenosylmethionine-diacylglycerol 3-amino-3-carboxypropyl transferase
MGPAVPAWLADAATLPIAFAQVREDPLLDQYAVEQHAPGARVLMISSGGCTAAYLAGATTVSHLHLVGPNPSQLALARLKLHILAHATVPERFALLGHAPLAADERGQRLSSFLADLDLAPDVLGPSVIVAARTRDCEGWKFAYFPGHLRPRWDRTTSRAAST